MFELSRRNLVIGAGLASTFGVSTRLAIDTAFAQKTADPAKGFITYKVGTAEVTAVYDGIFEKPHDPTFISNASVDDTKAAMVKAGLSPDFVSISGTVSVVRNGGKTILCDSGTGGYAPGWVSGKIGPNMRAAGIDPAKIDIVLISHFHPDHIFGLMEKDTNAQVYPNAEIVVSDVEYKFWTDPAVIDKLPEARKGLARRIQATFPTWKNIRQVTGPADVAPGMAFVMAPGHTPGHRAFMLTSGNASLMLSNDAMYVPALNVASRRTMMDRLVADKMMVAGFHFPFPGVGTIAKDGTGYALALNKA
jgi:glyoxylase-like metal-dependent hydrolase (beta-lactamase superfamily II)